MICINILIILTGAIPLTPIDVMDGGGRIVSSGLLCDGSETKLIDCNSRGRSYVSCIHAWDVGVRCLLHSSEIDYA